MWNFGSGSYGTEEAKAKLKGIKPNKKDAILDHNVELTMSSKPKDLEDDFDDFDL